MLLLYYYFLQFSQFPYLCLSKFVFPYLMEECFDFISDKEVLIKIKGKFTT